MFQYNKSIAEIGDFDVVVVGGGPAGIGAAVAASRGGAKVAMLERYGTIGGNLTVGNVNPILGSVSDGTIYSEVIALLAENHADEVKVMTRNGKEIHIDPEEAKTILVNFVHENGVQIMLQCALADVVKEGDRVTGVIVTTPKGLGLITCRVVIDATGDGLAAYLAGAEYKIGRDGDGKVQPVTLEFTVDNVDESRAITCWGGSDPVTLPNGKKYSDFCREVNERGELPKNVSIVRLHRTFYKGERNVNATQANGYDTLSFTGLEEAEVDLRNQLASVMDFLHKYVPGFENCRLKSTASTLGIRETRRICGDRTVCDEDVENGTRCADVAVHKAWFLIDIHNPAGGGQAEGRSHPAIPYDIPYGAFLPRGIEGMLTCGRCISGTHRAHASYRVMAVCLATGEAAGYAAALSVKAGITPRGLDVRELQKALIEKGVDLFN